MYDLIVPGNETFMTDYGVIVHNALNTFHFAGVASKSNVTRCVPRIEEIQSLSPEPKNPSENPDEFPVVAGFEEDRADRGLSCRGPFLGGLDAMIDRVPDDQSVCVQVFCDRFEKCNQSRFWVHFGLRKVS